MHQRNARTRPRNQKLSEDGQMREDHGGHHKGWKQNEGEGQYRDRWLVKGELLKAKWRRQNSAPKCIQHTKQRETVPDEQAALLDASRGERPPYQGCAQADKDIDVASLEGKLSRNLLVEE